MYIYIYISVHEHNRLFRKPPLLGLLLSCAILPKTPDEMVTCSEMCVPMRTDSAWYSMCVYVYIYREREREKHIYIQQTHIYREARPCVLDVCREVPNTCCIFYTKPVHITRLLLIIAQHIIIVIIMIIIIVVVVVVVIPVSDK